MADHAAQTAGDTAPQGDDWAARATRAVGTFVELIRDHSVRYVLLAAAILVIALGVLGTAVATVILIAVGLSRLFENLVFSGHMWATDTLVGGIFVLLGALSIALGNRTRAS